MNCLICFERFDDQKRAPLIVRQCGHSACQTCLQSLFDRALKYGDDAVKCPFCNTPEPIPSGTTDLRKVFPVNFLFVQNAAGADGKPPCDHPAKLRRFICIDPQCATAARFCFDCSRKSHSLCTEGCVMEQGVFEANTDFVRTFEPTHLFSKKEVRKAIDRQTADLRNMLCSLADETEALIGHEYTFLQRARNNSDFYLQHSAAFACEKAPAGGKMTVRMKSESHLFDFASEMTRFLTVGIWDRIGQLYDRIVLDNGKAFLGLNADVLRDNRKLVNRFLKTEQLAFAERSAHFPKVSFPFTLEKYLDGIGRFLKDTERRFEEREVLELPAAVVKDVFGFCGAAIDEESVAFTDLGSYVLGRLEQRHPASGGKWTLEHLDRNYLKVGCNQYSYMVFAMQMALSETAFFG